MATQLIRKNEKSKSNWMRMIDAANKLEFSDGRLLPGKGWRIDDMDVKTISTKLTDLGIQYEVDGLYKVVIL